MKFQYLILLIIICFQINHSNGENQKLKHPHEIDINHDEEIDIIKLSFDRKELNNDAVMYYLRLVKQIFTKQRFKRDPQSDEYYIGAMTLQITKLQYELLVNTDISSSLNLNEIDGLLEEIFKQSLEKDNFQYSATKILFEYYKQELIDSITSFSSPILWFVISIFVIFILSQFLHLSKVTYSATVLFLIFVFCAISYAMMYHDCLNDLEVEQMIQMSKEKSMNNPCKDYHREHESFWSSMKASIIGSAENDCLKHMRSTFKPSKKYCDPLDVFAKWSAKIQMSYFSSIIGEFFELLSSMTSSSSIFTKIVSWTASVAFFAFVLITLIKIVVQYSFQGFFGIISSSSSSQSNRKSSIELLNSKMDALLIENEHMKRELLVIRECSVERSIKNSSPPPSIKKIKLESIAETSQIIVEDNKELSILNDYK
ncbi:hypothetical protein PVAND_003597 [Polypedilum vanderplanki]|uniref:Chloride channel CLIC-like protein 1 n=1 Tax=Polypedilum vanderplanki TaxID=319348 RepID=A0A9J6BWB7_POLVA|nr:hypothetical protein PVAND_003597 [Polypedilum vanderplanki]